MMLSVFFNWESYDDVHKAIGREKQLKGWGREKKEREEGMGPSTADEWSQSTAHPPLRMTGFKRRREWRLTGWRKVRCRKSEAGLCSLR